MDENAKDVPLDRLRGFIRGFGSHWYGRKLAYLWVKRNRKDGYFKFVPCEHRIKAKKLWDSAPIKKVDESLIGKYLYVSREEAPSEVLPWKYEYWESYNRTGDIIKVKYVGVVYQSINNNSVHVTQCRLATEEEITKHEMDIFEEESIGNCKKYNVLPVMLKKHVGDKN